MEAEKNLDNEVGSEDVIESVTHDEEVAADVHRKNKEQK
jgi:hypothetical protein